MISVVVVGGWALIGLAGEFDLANSNEIVAVGSQLANEGVTDVTVDLTAVTYLAAAGCNALIAVHDTMRAAGNRMVLIGAAAATRRVLRLTGLDQNLPLTSADHLADPAGDDAKPLHGPGKLAATDNTVRSQLCELRRLLLTEGTVADDLRQIARATVSIVPGVTAATVAVRALGELRTAAVSDSIAIDVDAAQYIVNEGPCLTTARDGRTVRVDALTADERFTHFAPLALEVGIRAVMSIPIVVRGDTVGSLNIYSTTSFGPSAEAMANIMAGLAATAMVTTKSSG